MNRLLSQHLSAAMSLAIALTSILSSLPAQACPQASSNKATMTAGSTTKTAEASTIVEVAAANPSFSTLVKAVKAAGLVEVLSGQSPFTVFAPTDAAFAALPKGTLEKLLKPENREALKKVLTYHVVSGALKSNSLKSGQVQTVGGNPVNVRVSNGQVVVNNARVTKADIPASNGVIHVIDRVILPPDL